MRHTNRARLLAGLWLAGLLLAACAAPDRDDSGPGQGGATTVPTTLPGGAPATQPTRPAGHATVTGTVRDGVELGCLLLDTGDGRRYLLVGGERAELQAGARVRVTGRLEPDLASTCQQGEPLLVASIEPAP
jgi:Protein of unknown function (DUF5818)